MFRFISCNIKTQTILIGINKNNLIKEKLNRKHNVNFEGRLFKLIVVGSLYPIKGINYLLNAIKVLSKRRQDFKLDIIGGGEKYSDYELYITNNQIEKFVTLHGFKTHEETLSYIAEADIAIQASISEGLSVFLQESIFLGKAVVATNVGGTSDIVIDGFNGFLIEPQNPQEIADRINILLSNTKKLQLYSKNSLKIAREKLSLEENMKKIADIYYSI